MTCRSCGQPVADDARFCPNCGALQTVAEEERRVVTALFADIVGFTGLAEHRDPEEVKHLVDRCFEQLANDITEFGGVVDKVVGDAIVALFGAPVAHEDDPERAVRAALKMQATLQSMAESLQPAQTSLASAESLVASTVIEMRIGINTGEVLVGTSRAGGDYTAMGDVMNSASRLQGLAQPSEILVGQATYNATNLAISYDSAGEHEVRGREELLAAWRAVESIRLPGAHRSGPDIFVGREHERQLLSTQSIMAVRQRRTQLSVVVGEAGMGKSRLVEEVARDAVENLDAVILRGRCVPYGEANVWWPVAEVLRGLFELPLDLDRVEVESKLRGELAKMDGGRQHVRLERHLQALLHSMGFKTPLRGGDRNRNRSEVFLAFTNVMEHILVNNPVVLLMSDMHWAADAVWALLDHTLGELSRSPLMVLMTAREVTHNSLFEGQYGTSVLQLGPLSDDAMEHLVDELAPDLPTETATDLVIRSGGNPFFLEELIDLVLANNLRASENPQADPNHVASDSASSVALLELPDTLRGIVSARLDALEVSERSLLEDAAVLGRNSTVAGLATLASVTREVTSIDVDLNRLVAGDFLVVDGPRYEFRSDLVRDVAYSRLPKTARAQRHYGIARWLESAQTGEVRNSVVVAIADHYRSAAQLVSELSVVPNVDRLDAVTKALYWLDQAGERALNVGESNDAEKWFTFGVELAVDDETLAKFLYGRAKARCEVRDIAGARNDLGRLDTLAGHDPVMSASSLLIRGDVDRKARDHQRASSRLREAADRFAALGIANQQALALRLLGLNEISSGDDALARQALDSSRQVAAQANDRRSEAWALQSMSWHEFTRGRIQRANQLVSQAIEIFVEIGDQSGLIWAQGVQAWVAFHSGQWQVARSLVEGILPEVKRQGDPWGEALILNLAGSLALWSGKAAEAMQLTKQAEEKALRAESLNLSVQARAFQGRALVSLGRIAEGTAALEEAFVAADRAGDRASRRIAIISNCASAVRLGEPERAIRWAARFDDIHEEPNVVGEADLVVSLALAMLQRGSVDEAASQLSWSQPTSTDTVDFYGIAVGAIVAAVQGRPEAVEQAASSVLADGSTYLDRVFVLMAKAGVSARADDEVGVAQALQAASSELRQTDDETTRLIVALAAAIFTLGDVEGAGQKMRRAGMDPKSWKTVWELVGSKPGQQVTDSL